MSLYELNNQYHQLLGKQKDIERRLIAKQNEFLHSKKAYDDTVVAQTIIHTASRNTQNKLKKSIEEIVTTSVASVFGDESYDFVVEFETKNNRTHCLLFFKDADGEMFNGEDDLGGSVSDIGAFACRVSLWTLMGDNRTSPIFLLDENMKHLSESYRALGSALLKAFCDKLGMQIIISTHLNELIENADSSIEIRMGRKGGYSKAYVK